MGTISAFTTGNIFRQICVTSASAACLQIIHSHSGLKYESILDVEDIEQSMMESISTVKKKVY